MWCTRWTTCTECAADCIFNPPNNLHILVLTIIAHISLNATFSSQFFLLLRPLLLHQLEPFFLLEPLSSFLPQISSSLIIDDNKWWTCAFHWQPWPSRYIHHVCANTMQYKYRIEYKYKYRVCISRSISFLCSLKVCSALHTHCTMCIVSYSVYTANYTFSVWYVWCMKSKCNVHCTD